MLWGSDGTDLKAVETIMRRSLVCRNLIRPIKFLILHL